MRFEVVIFACAALAACNGDPKPQPAAGEGQVSAPARPAADSVAPARVVRAGPPVVLVAGTSLTAGLGLEPDEAYPALLQRKADSAGFRLEFRNAGVSGETSAGLLRRIDWLLREQMVAIAIETGANDGLRGLDVTATAANIRAIVKRARTMQPNAVVLLMQMEAPPNLGARYTGAFHEMYGTIAREEGATLVPFLLDKVAGVARLNQGDGIHPNEVGEGIVAENVWRAMEPVLRGRR